MVDTLTVDWWQIPEIQVHIINSKKLATGSLFWKNFWKGEKCENWLELYKSNKNQEFSFTI